MKLQELLKDLRLDELGIGDYSYTEELTPRTLSHYKKWIERGLQGPLSYLSDERKDIRENLKTFFPEAQSALVFLFPYKKKMNSGRIASFISGFGDRDYHEVIETHLTEIAKKLQEQYPELIFKISIDKHPVLDRDLAFRAGLGWFGKSSMLIHPKLGTLHLIGSILLSQKFDHPLRKVEADYCGACQRCMETCPTKAIIEPKVVEASKCISCFTLEHFKKVAAPEGYENQSYIAGCDRCQEVCPWNKKHLISEGELTPLEKSFEKKNEEIQKEIEALSKKDYLRRFRGTSFYRLGKRGFLKNL